MKAEYNSNEITAKVIKSSLTYLTENDLPEIGSLDDLDLPKGISVVELYQYNPDFSKETQLDKLYSSASYGSVIHIRTEYDSISEIFVPGITSSNAQYGHNEPAALYVRGKNDINYDNHVGWSGWRRLAYYDEIEKVVTSILKDKDLIT